MRAFELTEQKKTKLNSLEFKALLTPGLLKLDDIYKKNDHDLRIVGGAVRDLILGKKPKDVDLASDAQPEESIKYLEKAGIRVIPTGIQHGTITAVVNGEDYEITTLRIDTEHTGRHATVEYTRDWKKDAERRDLTFNAMSLELDGTLHDYFGGVDDLKKGWAQFVGDADARIKEDYLRILRYFRFQGRTSRPEWNEETLTAIERNAKGLEQISGERVWMEISKILSGDHTAGILKKMQDTGTDLYIGLPAFHDEKLLNRVKKYTNNPATILASFIVDVSDVDKLSTKWKFSVPERDLIKFIVANKREKFDPRIAKQMWTNPKIKNEYVLELAAYFGRDDIINELKTWKTPVFPITGKDLQALGVNPGPEFGKILRALETKWKESEYKLSKEDLLRMISKQESLREDNDENFQNLAEIISKLSISLSSDEIMFIIHKFLTEKYNEDVAAMFYMLITVAKQTGNSERQLLQMIFLHRWDTVRSILADNIKDIEYDIYNLLRNPVKIEMIRKGLRIVK